MKANTKTKETEILEGLKSDPKFFYPKFLYNDIGVKLFAEKTKIPEYYLKNKEVSILKQNKKNIIDKFKSSEKEINIIELGVGDGIKTNIILDEIVWQNYAEKITFIPIDINESILKYYEQKFHEKKFPFPINPINNSFENGIEKIPNRKEKRNIILWFGATIGNMTARKRFDFLNNLNHLLNKNDLVVIGFDLNKKTHIVRNAYETPPNDLFYFNALNTINETLKTDFKKEDFIHFFDYDNETGEAFTKLIKKKGEKIKIKDTEISFENFEPIYISPHHKFHLSQIEQIAENSGFRIKKYFTDSDKYFMDVIFEKIDNPKTELPSVKREPFDLKA
ncbi:L-histidine N(alpha)-methyltransferase [Aureivirga sp. CE67]|uniref:L-histidine N(alpha)-methyltransferase n=1 Tax=Aureivirga sp. CE67 TaxID=1788983 RepID=UPI0018CA6BF6|nr:L-histidine N(alpha)-methyltransferase [Aureivirga sp. CE67]